MTSAAHVLGVDLDAGRVVAVRGQARLVAGTRHGPGGLGPASHVVRL